MTFLHHKDLIQNIILYDQTILVWIHSFLQESNAYTVNLVWIKYPPENFLVQTIIPKKKIHLKLRFTVIGCILINKID